MIQGHEVIRFIQHDINTLKPCVYKILTVLGTQMNHSQYTPKYYNVIYDIFCTKKKDCNLHFVQKIKYMWTHIMFTSDSHQGPTSVCILDNPLIRNVF